MSIKNKKGEKIPNKKKDELNNAIKKRKPSPENITKLNLNDELFEAIKEMDLEKTKKLLKKGAVIDRTNNEIVKKYENLFYEKDYSKKEMEKLYTAFNEALKDEWAWADLAYFPGRKSLLHWKLHTSIMNSIEEGDLIEFKNSFEKAKEENINLINETHKREEPVKEMEVIYMRNMEDILSFLQESGEEYNYLMLAVEKNNMKMFDELIEMGININFENKEGNSALSIAKKHNRKKMIQKLKELKSN
jgi:hypothetical protein